MDFKRPERCQRQRTGREDRRSKFYEISDNLRPPVRRANASCTEQRSKSISDSYRGCLEGAAQSIMVSLLAALPRAVDTASSSRHGFHTTRVMLPEP
jgi:hypothetical protein